MLLIALSSIGALSMDASAVRPPSAVDGSVPVERSVVSSARTPADPNAPAERTVVSSAPPTPRTAPRAARSARIANPTFAWPVRGKISSHFGRRRRGVHHGTDIVCPRWKLIRSSARGRVVSIRRNWVYGKYVVLRHARGYSTLYGHLARVRTKRGRIVAAGEIIGECGSTGLSTGPHLHFEVRRGRHHVDPLRVLPGGRTLR